MIFRSQGRRPWDRPMRRYALRDDQWDRIKLPGREGHVGGTAADNRLRGPF